MTAIFCRIKEAKPNNLIHHFKRYYFQIHTPRLINHQAAASQRLSDFYFPSKSPKVRAIFQRRDGLFNSRVRFFAAPVQIKKEEMVTPSRPRLNEEIKADILRVVIDEGHTVMSRHEAMRRAKILKLDLVEVDRNAKPPVCKIMDYHRERYKKQVRDKERAKIKSAGSLKRGGCKEVRVSAKTESKDLKMKADTIKRMMERGYRVKCMATGTEDQDLSGILSQISALIEDVAFVEEKRLAYIIVRHVKFGMSKKGGKKASKDKTAASPEIEDAATACSDSPADLGEGGSEESDLDNDGEVDSPLQCQEEPAWSATSEDQNFDKMFELSHNVKETSSSQEKQIRFDSKPAASTANNNASRFSSPEVPSFAGPNVRSVTQETENRYGRSTAENASDMMNPLRFPNNETHPQSHPHSSVPPPKGPRQGGLECSPPMNFRLPPDEVPQLRGETQYQSSQPNSFSSGSIGQRQPPNNIGSPRSESSVFGTFSSTKVDAPEGPRQGGLESSPPKNFHLPPNEIPQPRGETQYRPSQPNSFSSGSIRHRQPPSNTGSPRSESTGFGTFSSTKVDAPEGPRQGGLEGSPSMNFRIPPDQIPQPRGEIQNRPSQPDNNSSGFIGQWQLPSNSNPRSQSQSTGFGIFSSTKVDANNPDSSGPPNVTRTPSPSMVPGNLNPPILRSDGPKKSEVAEKKWGIFSK